MHRSFTKGRLKCPKTEASRRAVPLQTIALEAIKQQPASRQSALLFPAERAGYLNLPMLPTIALAKVSCARVRRSGRAPLGGMRG